MRAFCILLSYILIDQLLNSGIYSILLMSAVSGQTRSLRPKASMDLKSRHHVHCWWIFNKLTSDEGSERKKMCQGQRIRNLFVWVEIKSSISAKKNYFSSAEEGYLNFFKHNIKLVRDLVDFGDISEKNTFSNLFEAQKNSFL